MLYNGNCLDVLKNLKDNSVDSVVTDPPYELGFMGKSWDNTGIANNKEMWAECLRVLKPGGHLLSFSGTRTYHRMACAIEDAGFEVRDMIEWVYSTGFPKSLNVKKQLEKKYGTKTLSKHDLRPLSETDLSQTELTEKEQREILQPSVQKQSVPISREATNNDGGKEPSVEGRNNLQTTERELQKCPLCEMSKGMVSDGEKRRIHNGTPISNGEALEQIADENRSSASHRPQSSEQPNYELDALCKQCLAQEIRRYDGIGTALKPAHEPICMARKPLSEKTVAENCLKWGTGGINIDESRVGTTGARNNGNSQGTVGSNSIGVYGKAIKQDYNMGRFPANLILSWNENEYIIRDEITNEQKQKALKWIYENA